MKIHKLKILGRYAESIMMGKKRAEVRENDRDFQCFDQIVFNVVFDPSIDENTMAELKGFFENRIYKITHVLHGGKFGIFNEFCVLSIDEGRHKIIT